jgi:hypothetical protein
MSMPSLDPNRVPDLTSEHFLEKGSSRAQATGSMVLALVFFLLAWLAATRAGAVVGGGIPGFVVATVAGTALAYFGAHFVVRAKRYKASSAQKLLARDPRPPVLYFRPFAADATAGKSVTFTSWFTEEEEVAKVMNEIGPFVAIGAPNEAIPELGAARFYTADSEWQKAVQYLLARARLVVLRIGRTDGFWWELKKTLSYRKPQELLLLIPRDEKLYEEFRQNSRQLFASDLPRLTGWNYRKLWRGSLMAAIYFDPDWVANIVEMQTFSLPFFRRSPAYPLVPVLKMALRRLYENLGLPWKPPGVSWRMIMTLGSLALFVGALALQIEIQNPHSFSGLLARTSVDAGAEPASGPSEQDARLAAVMATERQFADRLAEVPGWREQLQKLIESDEFQTLSRAEKSARVQGFGRMHSHAGMSRLDDDSLILKLELDQKLIAVTDPATCAAYSRGQVSSDLLHGLLSQLDQPDLDRWYDLLLKAAAADMAGSPPQRRADSERVQQTMQTIMGALPQSDAQNLRRILGDYGHASDEEVCWSERTLRQGISGLDKNDQVNWALSILH